MKYRHTCHVIGVMITITTVVYVTDVGGGNVGEPVLLEGEVTVLAVLMQWPSVILSESRFNNTTV